MIATLPRHRDVPWLFWNLKFRKPLRSLQYYWEEFRSKAGLRDVRLHDLRHTFASHAAMNKESIPMIGRLLGHVKAESTSRYSHLGDEHLLEASEQIHVADPAPTAAPEPK